MRQQAITWANVDLDLCHHMTSLGHNEWHSTICHHTFDNNQNVLCSGGGTLVAGCNVTYPVGFVACVCIFVIWSSSYKLHKFLGTPPWPPEGDGSIRWRYFSQPRQIFMSFWSQGQWAKESYVNMKMYYTSYLEHQIYICSSWTLNFEVSVADNTGRS